MSTTASSFGISSDDYSIDGRIARQAKPYQDPEILSELYVEQELSTIECGDRLGCSQSTVHRWLDKHNIERRSVSEAVGVDRAAYSHSSDGHPRWSARSEGETKIVGVHRMLAIAEGADPHEVFSDGTHCHHKNGHPFDNRPDNIEVVNETEHHRAHASNDSERTYDEALGCEVLEINDE